MFNTTNTEVIAQEKPPVENNNNNKPENDLPKNVSKQIVNTNAENDNSYDYCIKGTIIDSRYEQPLANVAVKLTGKNIIYKTDQDGNFKIPISKESKKQVYTVKMNLFNYRDGEFYFTKENLHVNLIFRLYHINSKMKGKIRVVK